MSKHSNDTSNLPPSLLHVFEPFIHLPVEQLRPTDRLSDLGFDEMSLIELCVELEASYDIHISDESIQSCETLGDIHAMIRELSYENQGVKT